MTKEWLEFLGGLFVFLAALVPVFRGIWRSLGRRLAPRVLLLLFLLICSLVSMTLWLLGHWLHWNPLYQVVLLTAYISGQVIAFICDDAPISRANIALLVLTTTTGTALLAVELGSPWEKDHRTENAIKASPAPSN
jgi:hypothetical protein